MDCSGAVGGERDTRTLWEGCLATQSTIHQVFGLNRHPVYKLPLRFRKTE